MNIIYAGFPGLGFQVKNLCVMFVFSIVYFLFFSEYQFAVDIVQGLEFTNNPKVVMLNVNHLNVAIILL